MGKSFLVGRKEISGFVGRSWHTIRRWIDEDGFPAVKIDGVWESHADLVEEWRKGVIGNRDRGSGSPPATAP